ncbi:MAG TPA: hypothetical protein VF698_16920, partial [Thermoanaerobaculia bacterium]
QHFAERLTLRPLPPGTQEIVLQSDFDGRIVEIARRQLEVTDARQPFALFPNWTRTGRIEPVSLDLSPFDACSAQPCNPEITFGGVPARRVESTPTGFLALPPERGPGVVDVVVKGDRATIVAKNAFRYYDENAPVDNGFFERVLFPVTFGGPGANGSSWATEIFVKNRSASIVDPLYRVVFPIVPEIPPQPFNPGLSSIDGIAGPRGALVFVPRDRQHDLTYSTIVRNLARQGEDFGVEVPVVRESDTRSRIELLDVPNDPSSRLLLRIYDIDSLGHAVTIAATPHDNPRARVLRVVALRSGRTPSEPAYAEIDLRFMFPELVRNGRYEFEIFVVERDVRLWAFVSVTNNATQRVTVLTPQHAQEAR